MKKLVGCINTLTGKTIKTRWFYVDKENNIAKDVTEQLFKVIDKFNSESKESHSMIPYKFKDGLTVYSFGCGLSHYLQKDLFEQLQESGKDILSFDLTECSLDMYTPSDMKNIFNCKSVWDMNLQESLLN